MTVKLPPSCCNPQLLQSLAGSDTPQTIARAQLDSGQQHLDSLFDQVPIAELVFTRSQLIDQFLLAAWQLFELDQADCLALVAVGGYGRQELHPASDIDLLLLCQNDPQQHADQLGKIENFIAFLWDIGLEIGHSLRSIAQSVTLAQTDITVVSNIMEARTLTGNPDLLPQLVSLTAPDKMWPAAEFFAAKRDEQLARHERFNDTEFNLEPDIKKAPGGLRDLHTINWVTRRYFHTENLDELVQHHFITQRELHYLLRCRDLLWRIRWWLHRLSGRNENRLLFDYQRDVAKQLGFKDNNANLAVEHFMKDYYRSALALSVLNSLLLQLFEEAILEQDTHQHVTPLNRHFQLRNHYIEAVTDTTFKHHPDALLEVFLLQAQDPAIKGIRAQTVRQMFEARHCIDDNYRNNPAHTALFMRLLRTSGNLHQQLIQMKRYGILGQYLPEFGAIIGMMQYDLFHRYTVDAHILLTIKKLRQMRVSIDDGKLTLANRIFYRLPKPELLYIAALYHDIAKGRNGDHSTLGAEDAKVFCQRHGLTRWDTKLVCWLVEHHLLMSITAQRKDISDPDVVYDFAHQMGDMVHLDYLYLLTIADISATNPKLWNSWREALLLQLHRETTRALRRGLDNPINKKDWIDENRSLAATQLKARGLNALSVSSLLASLGNEYFLRETLDNIVWHTEAILHHKNSPQAGQPLILIREPGTDSDGGTQVFVYVPDNKNLFAVIVNALDHLNLTIMDARIITSTDGYSLDTFVILDENGTPIGHDSNRLTAIHQTLLDTLSNPTQFSRLVERRLPRQYRYFDVPTQVVISNDLRKNSTVVDIETLDRPGLLAHIGQIFMRFNLLVQNARIATFGERAEDVFLVTDQQGNPLSDPAIGEALRTCLQNELAATPR